MSTKISLNFQLPKNVLTEEIPLWKDFYSYLDELFEFKELTKNEAAILAKDFYSLSLQKKQESLHQLNILVVGRRDQRIMEEEIISTFQMEESAENLVYGLSEEQKEEFYQFIAGEEDSDEIIEYQTLNLGRPTTSMGMTPEQVERRFATSPQSPFNNASIANTSPTTSSPSNIKKPAIPIQSVAVGDNGLTQETVVNSPANDISNKYIKKTSTLEDLL